jgi:hypothetical protein
MKNGWIHWVPFVEFGFSAILFGAFCGTVAWRNRRNQFLFFGWLGVLVVFILADIMVLVLSLRASK